MYVPETCNLSPTHLKRTMHSPSSPSATDDGTEQALRNQVRELKKQLKAQQQSTNAAISGHQEIVETVISTSASGRLSVYLERQFWRPVELAWRKWLSYPSNVEDQPNSAVAAGAADHAARCRALEGCLRQSAAGRQQQSLTLWRQKIGRMGQAFAEWRSAPASPTAAPTPAPAPAPTEEELWALAGAVVTKEAVRTPAADLSRLSARLGSKSSAEKEALLLRHTLLSLSGRRSRHSNQMTRDPLLASSRHQHGSASWTVRSDSVGAPFAVTPRTHSVRAASDFILQAGLPGV